MPDYFRPLAMISLLAAASSAATAWGQGLAASDASLADANADVLVKGFNRPPAEARPRVWWHWMNGNISREGIQLDLEWMHSVGIGGFQIFDAALKTPQVVPHRLVYMSPEWKEAFRYATALADKYGMEETIAGSPGWSESGGPWVAPSQGMKKYVWSETLIEGGRHQLVKLPRPPSVTGPFQDAAFIHEAGTKTPPQFYADSAVIAYRRPAGDIPLSTLHPKLSSSGGSPDFSTLTDARLDKSTLLSLPTPGAKAWIQYEFPQTTLIRAITIATRKEDENPKTALESSDDGQVWHRVAGLPEGKAFEHTISFPGVAAKYFRVTFLRAASSAAGPATFKPAAEPDSDAAGYKIAELMLHPGARVNRFEEKAAFATEPDLYGFSTPPSDADQAVKKSEVIDLTSRMRPDGTLDWTPPPGPWVVLRFGYSLLGITNHPATEEATGLEVDKLDHRYVRQYMENYLESYKQAVGAGMMGRRGIRYVINDSWEAGPENWTDRMIEQFRRLRGYDPLPWMPVLTGEIVDSAAASDKFLWDFRKTIADLIAEEHYGELQNVLHEWHMGHYAESHEGGRVYVADGMEVKKFSEVPMGAMWTQSPGVNKEMYNYNTDDRESASVAHIYGQNIVAAESMTARASSSWAWSPATLKPTADQELLNGINRFCIHESAHQPLVGKQPGLTLGQYGQWFNRNETWAAQAGPWISYLGRSSFMLQQGHFAADLLYFYGEDSNLTAIFRYSAPDVPTGYGFDYVNADALIHALHVVDGRITTPGGTSYRLLGLDPYSIHMSLPVLRAIHQLVMQGATVAGPKPIDDPSLADDPAEFHRLADELFGDGAGIHRVGRGVVYAGKTPAEALAAMGIPADFDYRRPDAGASLQFVHRKLADGDIYFVDNRSDKAVQVDARFRVAGRQPELWHAESGRSEAASYTITGGHTTVPIKLEAWGTVFVVFRQPALAVSRSLPVPKDTVLTAVSGPWKLSFPPHWGAPASIMQSKLSSWTDSQVAGVKYFSGTGTYTHPLRVPAAWLHRGTRILLDLGEVKDLAEVQINGKHLGVIWHAPYRVDISKGLKTGVNKVIVRVTNTWANRVIGDQQPHSVHYTFTDVTPYGADSPLMPSGLLGPVTVLEEQMQ